MIEARARSVEESLATQKGSTNYDGGNPRDFTDESECCQPNGAGERRGLLIAPLAVPGPLSPLSLEIKV